MTIQYVQQGFSTGSPYQTALTNTAGNLLVVVYFQFGSGGAVSFSDTNSNSYHVVNSQVAFGGGYGGMYYAWNIAGGTNTITASGVNQYLAIEYSGVRNTSDPLEGSNSNSGNESGGTFTSASFSATGNDLLTLMAFSSTNTTTANSPFTVRQMNPPNTYPLSGADYVPPSGGSQTCTFGTSGSNGVYGTIIAGFAPASSVAPAPFGGCAYEC